MWLSIKHVTIHCVVLLERWLALSYGNIPVVQLLILNIISIDESSFHLKYCCSELSTRVIVVL